MQFTCTLMHLYIFISFKQNEKIGKYFLEHDSIKFNSLKKIFLLKNHKNIKYCKMVHHNLSIKSLTYLKSF